MKITNVIMSPLATAHCKAALTPEQTSNMPEEKTCQIENFGYRRDSTTELTLMHSSLSYYSQDDDFTFPIKNPLEIPTL